MLRLNEKKVVITGAAQGIGAAIAARFLQEGAGGVALLDLQERALEETCKSLQREGAAVFPVACDVTRPDSVAAAFEAAYETLGRVDILVNSAGITRDAFAHKMSTAQFDSVVQVSLNGSFYCTGQVITQMKKQRWGRILFLSSLAARGNPGQANYSAAKAGLMGLAATLALELGRDQITVNCIAPGLINTDMIKTIPEKQRAAFRDSIPMQRFGEPEEVAALAAFLASEEAAYISGQCIRINGALV